VQQGLRLSILGDSVSTYRGVSNDDTANASTRYNPCFYRDPFPLEKTYWRLLADALGMTLCVNNSWSGGNLSGRDNPDAGVNRAAQLSRDDGTAPDVVVVFMGLNDLGRRVDVSVFAADYQKTLLTIREQHPHAWVCCVNLPDRDPVMRQRTEAFNAEIQRAVALAGERAFVADLFASRLNNDFYYNNTVDGLHPDEDGMRIIAEVVREAFLANIV
jgi:lysophospholipase L1-like esterase